MYKLLLRLGAAGAAVAGTVWAVRKYQANKDRIEEVLQQQVAQMTELTKRVSTYLDVAATQFATTWLMPEDQGEPTEEEEPEVVKPADQYTNSTPLLDDGR